MFIQAFYSIDSDRCLHAGLRYFEKKGADPQQHVGSLARALLLSSEICSATVLRHNMKRSKSNEYIWRHVRDVMLETSGVSDSMATFLMARTTIFLFVSILTWSDWPIVKRASRNSVLTDVFVPVAFANWLRGTIYGPDNPAAALCVRGHSGQEFRTFANGTVKTNGIRDYQPTHREAYLS